jgi:predicted transcriptional regulator of viral defense system
VRAAGPAGRPPLTTGELFATRPVFSLDEAADALAPPGGRRATVERLKHHLETGRLLLVSRGVYAVVPAGVAPHRFQPDPVLVAVAARPDSIIAYHTALELLGAAQSVWRVCTAFTARRRRPVTVGAVAVRFLDHPLPLRDAGTVRLGVRTVERRGRLVAVTGPERTLVEGLRRPGLAGGLEELVASASSFPTLDLGLLEQVLQRYDLAQLWAAVGWFLERFQQSFHVPAALLDRLRERRPNGPQYLERSRPAGVLVARWNLVVPRSLVTEGEPDER